MVSNGFFAYCRIATASHGLLANTTRLRAFGVAGIAAWHIGLPAPLDVAKGDGGRGVGMAVCSVCVWIVEAFAGTTQDSCISAALAVVARI